jgi:glycosyltransferase involved in cell wall biosynthesis
MRARAATTVVRELTRHTPLRVFDVPLVLTVRNEAARLPPLFSYYRDIGVTRFLVLDDQSTDGTREFLLDQKDTSVFDSDVRFREAREGLAWRQAIVRIYGVGRWYINVDADEYLTFFSSRGLCLQDIFQDLENKGMRRGLAAMVDMYGPGDVRAIEFRSDRPPWHDAPLFDKASLRMETAAQGTRIQGGPRVRVFRRDGNRGKFPVLRWDYLTRFVKTVHHPLPYWRNFGIPKFALLHFRFFSDLELKARESIEDDQHTRIETQLAYQERWRDVSPIIFEYDGSRRFSSSKDLVDAGIIVPYD